jgi:NAD-dependent SIR2 family protein deacetylase
MIISWTCFDCGEKADKEYKDTEQRCYCPKCEGLMIPDNIFEEDIDEKFSADSDVLDVDGKSKSKITSERKKEIEEAAKIDKSKNAEINSYKDNLRKKYLESKNLFLL